MDVTTDIPMHSVLSIWRECDGRATSYDGGTLADRCTSADPSLWRRIWPGMGDKVGNHTITSQSGWSAFKETKPRIYAYTITSYIIIIWGITE